MSERIAKQHRKTNETDIQLTLNLDGSGTARTETGIGFFDHMLQGFARHGFFDLNDETLALCAIDLSGRPYFAFDGEFTTERVGYMDTEMVREFFYAVSYSAGMDLHMRILSGVNNHHMIEGLFKAFGRALDEATQIDPRIKDIMSTKGSL